MLHALPSNLVFVVGGSRPIGPTFCARLEELGLDVRKYISADGALIGLSCAPQVAAIVSNTHVRGSLNGLSLATLERRKNSHAKIILVAHNPAPHMWLLADSVLSDEVATECVVSTLRGILQLH